MLILQWPYDNCSSNPALEKVLCAFLADTRGQTGSQVVEMTRIGSAVLNLGNSGYYWGRNICVVGITHDARSKATEPEYFETRLKGLGCMRV